MKLINICTKDKKSKLHRLNENAKWDCYWRKHWKRPCRKTINRTLNYQLAKFKLQNSIPYSNIFNEYFGELEKNDKKPKTIALTETWLTKSDTEPKQQWKMRRANLNESYSIAMCSPKLSLPKDTGRKRGGPGYSLHESLSNKGIDYPKDFECAMVEVWFIQVLYRKICSVYRPHVNKVIQFLPELENLLQIIRRFK